MKIHNSQNISSKNSHQNTSRSNKGIHLVNVNNNYFINYHDNLYNMMSNENSRNRYIKNTSNIINTGSIGSSMVNSYKNNKRPLQLQQSLRDNINFNNITSKITKNNKNNHQPFYYTLSPRKSLKKRSINNKNHINKIIYKAFQNKNENNKQNSMLYSYPSPSLTNNMINSYNQNNQNNANLYTPNNKILSYDTNSINNSVSYIASPITLQKQVQKDKNISNYNYLDIPFIRQSLNQKYQQKQYYQKQKEQQDNYNVNQQDQINYYNYGNNNFNKTTSYHTRKFNSIIKEQSQSQQTQKVLNSASSLLLKKSNIQNTNHQNQNQNKTKISNNHNKVTEFNTNIKSYQHLPSFSTQNQIKNKTRNRNSHSKQKNKSLLYCTLHPFKKAKYLLFQKNQQIQSYCNKCAQSLIKKGCQVQPIPSIQKSNINSLINSIQNSLNSSPQSHKRQRYKSPNQSRNTNTYLPKKFEQIMANLQSGQYLKTLLTKKLHQFTDQRKRINSDINITLNQIDEYFQSLQKILQENRYKAHQQIISMKIQIKNDCEGYQNQLQNNLQKLNQFLKFQENLIKDNNEDKQQNKSLYQMREQRQMFKKVHQLLTKNLNDFHLIQNMQLIRHFSVNIGLRKQQSKCFIQDFLSLKLNDSLQLQRQRKQRFRQRMKQKQMRAFNQRMFFQQGGYYSINQKKLLKNSQITKTKRFVSQQQENNNQQNSNQSVMSSRSVIINEQSNNQDSQLHLNNYNFSNLNQDNLDNLNGIDEQQYSRNNSNSSNSNSQQHKPSLQQQDSLEKEKYIVNYQGQNKNYRDLLYQNQQIRKQPQQQQYNFDLNKEFNKKPFGSLFKYSSQHEENQIQRENPNSPFFKII